MHCPGHVGMKGDDRVDRLAGKATTTSGLRRRRSEVLRSLRHYRLAQIHGHHTTDRQEEECAGRRHVRRSSLKRHERAIVSQTNTGTVSFKDSALKLRKEMGKRAHSLFRALRYHFEPNVSVEDLAGVKPRRSERERGRGHNMHSSVHSPQFTTFRTHDVEQRIAWRIIRCCEQRTAINSGVGESSGVMNRDLH